MTLVKLRRRLAERLHPDWDRSPVVTVISLELNTKTWSVDIERALDGPVYMNMPCKMIPIEDQVDV